MTTQDPLPLEKLPEYIKTHRNISSVVDMGKIVVIRNNWPKLIVYASAVCMLLGVVSATFITMSPKDITVVIAAKNSSPDFIANIVSVGGGDRFSAFKCIFTVSLNKSLFDSGLKVSHTLLFFLFDFS